MPRVNHTRLILTGALVTDKAPPFHGGNTRIHTCDAHVAGNIDDERVTVMRRGVARERTCVAGDLAEPLVIGGVERDLGGSPRCPLLPAELLLSQPGSSFHPHSTEHGWGGGAEGEGGW